MSKIPMFPNKFAIFASILGGLYDISSGTEYKNWEAKQQDIKCAYYDVSHTIYNLPCIFGFLVKFYSGGHQAAICFNLQDGTLYTRNKTSSGQWGSWMTVSAT